MRSWGHWLDELSILSIAGFLFLVGSNTQVGWVFLLSGTLFGALITSARLNRQGSKPTNLRLQTPSQVPRLQRFSVRLTWEGGQGYPNFWSPEDPGSFQLDPNHPSSVVLDPHTQQRHFSLVAQTRGQFFLIPSSLSCYGSLGWFPWQRSLQVPCVTALLVLPQRLRLSQGTLFKLRQQLGQSSQDPRNTSGEFRRLREYSIGDDIRRIHWPSSARRGQLLMREESASAQQNLTLCWGCDPKTCRLPGSEIAFESLLDWLFSFFQTASEAGWTVQILQPSPEGWQRIEDIGSLAFSRPCPSGPPPQELSTGDLVLNFWLGPSPTTAYNSFEFYPEDWASPASIEPPPGREKRRILPGQHPDDL